MELRSEGLRVRLPRSWEGRITRNPARTHSRVLSATDGSAEDPGEVQPPVAHLANFVLPGVLDDFGAQAVPLMRPGNCFVALVEYGPTEVGTPLFEEHLPRRLQMRDFSPGRLQRRLPDQLGTQVFATEASRAFCLYVVLAGRQQAGAGLAAVNEVLSTLELQSR